MLGLQARALSIPTKTGPIKLPCGPRVVAAQCGFPSRYNVTSARNSKTANYKRRLLRVVAANLLTGWIAILGGIVSGAIAGLFFHRDDWMGGYNSYRRRMARLGHIAFAGLGFLNLAFAVTAGPMKLGEPALKVASIAFIAGAVTMPTCCFLTAWRKFLRHLFPIPVAAILTGLIAILAGWRVA